jgi:peptidoglycan-N-acetylglucosamine deacetylase
MHQWFRDASKELLQRVVLPGGFVWRLARPTRDVALTFDDGPHPQYTAAVLDMLARHKVKATFFMVGHNVDKYPELVRRMVAEGHSVGGHSYDHTVITTQTPEALDADLRRCREAIQRAAQVDSNLFRPPKGEVNFVSIRRVCQLGYRLVHWTKTHADYQQDGVEPLLARMNAQPPVGGDILLFHDHNPNTVAALEQQIPRWQSAGLSFASL